MHYNGRNSFLFVNATKIYQFQFKAKPYPLCLGNTSNDFTVNNIIKTILNGYVYDFYVGYNAFDISDITNIHNCFMKKLDVR